MYILAYCISFYIFRFYVVRCLLGFIISHHKTVHNQFTPTQQKIPEDKEGKQGTAGERQKKLPQTDHRLFHHIFSSSQAITVVIIIIITVFSSF